MAVDAASDSASSQRSAIERFLGLFTEVRAGEARTALLMFANVFLILCAYYFVKPLREGWIAISDISGLSKMEVKAYSSFAQSLLLLFVVGWSGRLANRFPGGRVELFAYGQVARVEAALRRRDGDRRSRHPG